MTIDYQKLLQHHVPPQWTHTPAELATATATIIQKYTEMLDQIAAVQNPTVSTVVEPHAQIYNEMAFLQNQISFYLSVAPNKELRDALTEAEKQLDRFFIEVGQRSDVFEVFKQLNHAVNHAVNHREIDPETSRYIAKEVQGYVRRGLNLPPAPRQQLKQCDVRLAELAVQFGKTMNELNEFILFSGNELAGVPPDVVAGFDRVGDKYKMTYKYPDLFPVLKHAHLAETRRRAYHGSQSKCASNGAVLAEMVRVRCQKARLLGYDNFSAYVLEDRMAQTPANVAVFLDDLRAKLTPLGREELTALQRLENGDTAKSTATSTESTATLDLEFYQWDMGYYHNLMLQQQYAVDHQEVQQYFPLDNTIKRMLGFYERILDVKFEPLAVERSEVWHEDVRVYGVFQGVAGTSDSEKSENECDDNSHHSSHHSHHGSHHSSSYASSHSPQFMGYIYFDLHPRDGKYSHAANFGLGPGYLRPDGSRQHVITALVCNFTKPTATKPSLLKHDEVTTLFHELGHGVHNMLSQTRYARFHGTAVPRDFVEAPSQMLEFWTWTPTELKALSCHHQTGEPISDLLVAQLAASKHVNTALHNLRQLHFALFDMALHTILDPDAPLDLSGLWNQMRRDITLLSTDNTATPGYASFGHIAHGYESGYYGYLYSQVFAVDIYYQLFKSDPMNEANGKRYRDVILRRGNSRDMMENLVELLGRQPSSESFMKELGC